MTPVAVATAIEAPDKLSVENSAPLAVAVAAALADKPCVKSSAPVPTAAASAETDSVCSWFKVADAVAVAAASAARLMSATAGSENSTHETLIVMSDRSRLAEETAIAFPSSAVLWAMSPDALTVKVAAAVSA